MNKTVDGVTVSRASRAVLSAPTPPRVSLGDARRAPSTVTLRAGYTLIAEATARGVVPADTGTRLCRLILETRDHGDECDCGVC